MSGYSSNSKGYYSAGILPYSIDSGGNVVFLLGQDNNSEWSDFGGRSEIKDEGSHATTASREFYEESLGAVKSMEEIKRLITSKKSGNVSLVVSKTLGAMPYYMYIIKIPYADYKKFFTKTYNYLKFLNQKYIEKRDIRWISIDTLLSTTQEPQTRDILISLRPIFRQTIINHLAEINKAISSS